jgi:CheY-like chemotaxis protein
MKSTNKYSVFIVDDDEDDRESIKDAFLENKHHYNYVFMSNGDQLLEYLVANPPRENTLILLDLNMPGKDGRDILKEIKNARNLKPIPVIVLTTSSSERDKQTSYELGANCFVTKPDSYNDLVDITNSIAKLWLVPQQGTIY